MWVHAVFPVTIQTGLITSVCAAVDLIVYLSLVRVYSLEGIQYQYTEQLFLRRIICMVAVFLLEILTHLRPKAPRFQYDPLKALFWSLFVIL